MTNQDAEYFHRKLEEATEEAAVIALAAVLEVEAEEIVRDPATAILEAARTIPARGTIKSTKHQRILKACSWLFNRIPDTDPRREQIARWLDDVLVRVK